MRTIPLVAFLLLPAALPAQARAQSPTLAGADSALVGRVLLAEDRRDASDPALADAIHGADPRIRTIAWRARARIADPAFAARDSLPPLPAPRTWPEPAWRLRFRALTAQRNDCNALRTALSDSAWAVRLQAADLVGASCAGDDAIIQTLRSWVDALPADASSRSAGGVSWHAAAHALVALARVRPSDARLRLAKLATHTQWEARMYAARAAAALSDSATLRTLARDRNDDVREAASSPSTTTISSSSTHSAPAARRWFAPRPWRSKDRRAPTWCRQRTPRSTDGWRRTTHLRTTFARHCWRRRVVQLPTTSHPPLVSSFRRAPWRSHLARTFDSG